MNRSLSKIGRPAWAEFRLPASRGNASYPPVSRRSANARYPPIPALPPTAVIPFASPGSGCRLRSAGRFLARPSNGRKDCPAEGLSLSMLIPPRDTRREIPGRGNEIRAAGALQSCQRAVASPPSTDANASLPRIVAIENGRRRRFRREHRASPAAHASLATHPRSSNPSGSSG
jgi:hypothetical protein